MRRKLMRRMMGQRSPVGMGERSNVGPPSAFIIRYYQIFIIYRLYNHTTTINTTTSDASSRWKAWWKAPLLPSVIEFPKGFLSFPSLLFSFSSLQEEKSRKNRKPSRNVQMLGSLMKRETTKERK